MTRYNVMRADHQQGRLRNHPHAWYISGFVDGEGSFHIAFHPDERMKTGWKIIPEFHVSQRLSSRKVLDELVEFFHCGYVKPNHKANPRDVTYVYVVRDRQDLLTKILPFFRKYLLRTEKRHDFALFERVVKLMKRGKHLQKSGARRIVNLAYQMNGGGRYRQRSHIAIS